MIYCLTCEKYPRNSYVTPQSNGLSNNLFKVRLITYTTPSPLPTSGADVVGLSDSVKFAVGSKLYVISGEHGFETYIHDSTQFVLWRSNGSDVTPSVDNTSDIVDVGEVDYMILTA